MNSKFMIALLHALLGKDSKQYPADNCKTDWMLQKQDHFDPDNTNRWHQAYFVNDTFFKDDGTGPVFFCVTGETNFVVHGLLCPVAMRLAEQTGALVFGLEHRYYGCHNEYACPYDKKTPNHYQYLSSRQALGDIALFHKYATKRYGLTSENKWVSFGGSYAAMVAAWARTTYPELFHAAVAHAAPVVGGLNYREFNDIVANSYSLPYVGGSPDCKTAIAVGHARILSMFETNAGRHKLFRLFQDQVESADWLLVRSNRRNFAGCGVASFPSQANMAQCNKPACNIRKICNVMTDTSLGDEVIRLAVVAMLQEAKLGHACEIDFTGDNPDTGGDWGYQACTEFGFFQTCEVGSDCFYAQGLISFDGGEVRTPSSFCETEYNISLAQTKKLIDETNQWYGGRDLKGTRIYWINGEIDPWHGNSVLESPNPTQPVLMVQGAHHCEWDSEPKDGELSSLEPARQKIFTQVVEWLKED